MINNYMISKERKAELTFYINNGYPIMITSMKNDLDEEMMYYNDDVYTLSEMVYENYFRIEEYRQEDHIVTFTVTEDLNLFNGVSTVPITKGQRIDMHLDEAANEDFTSKFFSPDDQI